MIKKAVLPVAGLGTRFLPASKAIPKEMLPIIDKPLVQYAVEEAVREGINEIIFVTSPEKFSIKNHFKKNKKIESTLIKSGKQEIAEKINNKIFSKVKFYYINQENQNGLGDAILHAESIVGKNPFAVMLPDDLFFSEKSCLQQLIEIFSEKKSSVIAVNQIDKENIHKYGVIKPDKISESIMKIDDIIEKPNADEAPSDLAVCGRYIFNPLIFEYIRKTPKGSGGEIQLTDAIDLMLKKEKVYAYEFEGKRYDCGSKLGFLEATVDYGLNHPELSNDFKKYLDSI